MSGNQVKKPEIGQVIDAFYPKFDGPIQVTANYAKELNALAHCSVITSSAGKTDGARFDDGVFPYKVFRVKSCPTPFGYRLALPRSDGAFKRWFKAAGFDIIHAHSPFSLPRYVFKMAKKLGIPTVITLHTKFDLDFKRFTKSRFILRRLMRYIMGTFESADEVWTVNNATVETLRGYGYKGDVRVMRNGTDMTYPDNADTLAERVRTRYGLRADEPVLLFVGRIVMYKNLALICDALQAAKSGGFKFKMLVVGGGEDLNAFQKKAEDCGLKEEFIFAGKVTDREELSGYYLASDLFLFPSTFDTSSLVPVEAAAHKLPVLLIRGCSTAEGVTDGEDAFLSEENPADFAAKIQDAFSDRARLIRVGETARARIYRTWADAAAEALQHYTRIISDSRERTR